MKTKPLIVSSLMIGTLCAFAGPTEGDFALITIGTNTFTNAHLRAYSPSEGSITHDGGIKKIRLADLPEAIRSEFYDPQKEQQAIEATKKSNSERKAAAEARRSAEIERYKEANFRLVEGKFVNTKDWRELDGNISSVLRNGILLQLAQTDSVITSDPLRATGNFLGSGSTTPSTDRRLTDQIVFIACASTNFHDGQKLKIKVSPVIGRTNIDGRTYESYQAGMPYKAHLLKPSTSP
jgi:hypothetical protein